MNANGLSMVRKLFKTIVAFFVAMTFIAAPAAGFWVEDEGNRTDVRVYATMARLHPEQASAYPEFIVTRVWLDDSGSMVFIDWDGDGVEDVVHIQLIKFWMDGKPALGDSSDVSPTEALDAIKHYIKLHSAATPIKFETEGKHNV